MAEVICLLEGDIINVKLCELVNGMKNEAIDIIHNDREIGRNAGSTVDGNPSKPKTVTVLDNDREILSCLDRNSSAIYFSSKKQETMNIMHNKETDDLAHGSFETISALDDKQENNSAILNEEKAVNLAIFGSCTETITVMDHNVETISIGNTDSSSDEENIKISNPAKKVTRRGLNLAGLCSTNPMSEVKYPTSAIYSSKILDFRKQKRNINECFNSLNPSTLLDDDDDDITTSKKTRKINNKILEENTDQLNSDDKWITTVSNKPRNSPSPPPPPDHHPVVKKMTKKTRKLLGNIKKNMHLYDIAKQQYICESSVLPEKDLETNRTRTIVAKFRWQGCIFKITMKRDEKFLSVLPKVAETCQSTISDILLAINEETIQSEDSPNSIDLSSADIIDCYILNSSSTKDQNSITLLVQASDCKLKVSISMNKLSPLSELMEEYARRRSLPLRKLKFKFDGEIVEPTDTPAVLDMENENCIDVVVTS